MTITTAKWTILDYHRMIAAGILDDRQVELLHGEIQPIAFPDVTVSVGRILGK